MGVLGVALATVSCQAVSAVLVTWFLMRAKDIYRLEFHEVRFDLRSLGEILRIGLPAGLESVNIRASRSYFVKLSKINI